MKKNNKTNIGCCQLQTHALNDRKNILQTINQEAALLGIQDPLIPHRIFTSLFLQLGKTRWEQAEPPPMAFMRTIVRRILLGECRGEARRRRRERHYMELKPESSIRVAGISIDEVDFDSVKRALRDRPEQAGDFSTLARTLAVEIASFAATEKHLPAQSALAETLGVSQATISRALPAAMHILRHTIEGLLG